MAYDWRQGLPVLHGPSVVLREPRLTDAVALFTQPTTPLVARYISTPPSATPAGAPVCSSAAPPSCDASRRTQNRPESGGSIQTTPDIFQSQDRDE